MVAFDELIKNLCSDCGIEAPSGQALYSFRVDKDDFIMLEKSPHDAAYCSSFTSLDIVDDEKPSRTVHKLLLGHNAFGISTEDATFLIDKGIGDIIYRGRFHQYKYDYRRFLEHQANFTRSSSVSGVLKAEL